MKLIQDFNAFLNDTVNLNSTRFDQLESSIEAIKAAMRGLDWKPSIVGFAAGLTRPSSGPCLEIRSMQTCWFT
jgi:hypothetical protein